MLENVPRSQLQALSDSRKPETQQVIHEGKPNENLAEIEDFELALLRIRRAYEQRGYSRLWIEQRMRSVSARHELTGEWYRRGVRDGEQFRALTNQMMQNAF